MNVYNSHIDLYWKRAISIPFANFIMNKIHPICEKKKKRKERERKK